MLLLRFYPETLEGLNGSIIIVETKGGFMAISQKQWDELNVILAKQLGREPTKEELEQCGYTLTGLAELCYKQFRTEQGWKRKLEENPKGFPLLSSLFW